ncbi:MAG: putative sulfate exporter family transporter [Hyphomicrobiales bacterium]|nr:putative sulfate exporter family transporter [Hyphomicrobiales bacterium]
MMHIQFLSRSQEVFQSIFPGFLVASLIALAGQFISDHYGAPAMLMALLFGIALNFLSEEGHCVAGINFSARIILRLGVVLLGMRISFDMAAQLGSGVVILVVASLCLTIGFGLLVARVFGHGPRFAFLSAGSVAICGASAAMAISAILPHDERSEERLVFTVVGVTLLSTLAMIIYPIITTLLGFDDEMAGVFLGATIHDVAQVVGAGFTVSEQSGEVATVVKLIRVAMLAPVVLVATIIIRNLDVDSRSIDSAPPIIPGFILAFAILMALNSFHLLPTALIEISASASRWALLTAIAGVGLKTSLRDVLKVGGPAIALLVVETAFIALIMMCGIRLIG